MEKKGETWIICKNEDCFKQQGGTIDAPRQGGKFTSSKLSLSKVPEVYALAEGLLDSFKAKRNNPSTLQGIALTIDQELQAVESFFKTISGGFKE